MRRMLLGIATAALSLGATANVSAQDILYSNKPIAMWTGFYVGGNVGYGWGNTNTDASGIVAPPTNNYKMEGLVGGAQFGGMAQSGNFVIGFETDLQASGQRSNNIGSIAGLAVTDNNKMPWFGTARGRMGFAVDALLIYATGGLAYGQYKRDITFVGASSQLLEFSTFKFGWAAGAGLEGMMTKNWGWRAEYLHLQFGNFNEDFVVTSGGVTIGTMTMNTKVTNDIVRFGLNYFLR